MAYSLSPLEQDLACPVCFEIFKDPVILSCCHSLCRTCLEQIWRGCLAGRECPVCRQQLSEDHLSSNLALRNKCESFLQQRKEQASDTQRCSLHLEKLNLFCVDDEKLVCPKCVLQDHQNHSFWSIRKAAKPLKEKLEPHLTRLERKLYIFEKCKTLNDQQTVYIKSQAQNTENEIKEEFKKLHQFLREEEAARIHALREENEEKSQRMKTQMEGLNNQIMEISARIRELDRQLRDDSLLLQDFERASERAEYTVPDPEPDFGVLINVSKHLGNLRYRVWEKMKDLCSYFPVLLDPNTANTSLSLSADLSSVSLSAISSQVPDNLERMSAYRGVLGSEGFSSGTLSWEVDVGESKDWILGVAEESVSRKEPHIAVPENGFWCVWREDDEISAGISMSFTESLGTKPTLQKIRITLTWEKGLVMFSDMDSNTELYTFSHVFSKTMYPYFNNNSTHPLKIMPAHIG
ncbi:zinc-binding protein A33-like [Hoplias malabaricus]|uniref:zinc-binding protein A33-like n=1 Tax=Hoplias malabaricus TaxID=27720 RepID=UPI0034618D91